MKRLLPQTLFWRLILVLFAGLTLALAVSMLINYEDRGQLLLSTARSQSAQRIANTVLMLDSLDMEEQKRIISLINVPPQQVWLSNTALPTNESDAGNTLATTFATQILNQLGDNREIHVTQTATATDTPAQALPITPSPPGMGRHRMEGSGRMGMGMRHGMQRGRHANAIQNSNTYPDEHFSENPAGGNYFLVQVKLMNDLWIIFDTYTPQTSVPLPLRLLMTLLILFFAVLILSFIAVRWVTKPLHQLAQAADAFGQNINHPPLNETGPQEIRQAAHAFNVMQQRLQHATQEKNHMFAAISHDLKTPITRLRLRAEMLDDDELRQRFEHDLKEMELMVTQALDFMKGLDTEQQKQPIDIMALLESLQTDYADAGKTITIQGHTQKPFIGFAPMLKRCLMNLLDNAIFYGQQAHIFIEDSRNQLVLRISDEGPGIPEPEQSKAFEPFYRIEHSRNRETGGTGLGLYIARNIIQLHSGHITLNNRPQGGLEVTLTLPRIS